MLRWSWMSERSLDVPWFTSDLEGRFWRSILRRALMWRRYRLKNVERRIWIRENDRVRNKFMKCAFSNVINAEPGSLAFHCIVRVSSCNAVFNARFNLYYWTWWLSISKRRLHALVILRFFFLVCLFTRDNILFCTFTGSRPGVVIIWKFQRLLSEADGAVEIRFRMWLIQPVSTKISTSIQSFFLFYLSIEN